MSAAAAAAASGKHARTEHEGDDDDQGEGKKKQKRVEPTSAEKAQMEAVDKEMDHFTLQPWARANPELVSARSSGAFDSEGG